MSSTERDSRDWPTAPSGARRPAAIFANPNSGDYRLTGTWTSGGGTALSTAGKSALGLTDTTEASGKWPNTSSLKTAQSL
ncbi:MAG: hypothetical protein KDB20_12610 [Microthrixaceae bacterium]|nr:hypothetical protein [Microthrixaceae bacterium]